MQVYSLVNHPYFHHIILCAQGKYGWFTRLNTHKNIKCEGKPSKTLKYLIQTYVSTVYIGIAMVFVSSPYISFYFQFQVNSISDDFAA